MKTEDLERANKPRFWLDAQRAKDPLEEINALGQVLALVIVKAGQHLGTVAFEEFADKVTDTLRANIDNIRAHVDELEEKH